MKILPIIFLLLLSVAAGCGVAEADAPSSISLSISEEMVEVGEPFRVWGFISPPQADITIRVKYIAYPATVIHYVSTAEDGSFNDTRIFQTPDSWTVVAIWLGDADHEGVTSPTRSFEVTSAAWQNTLNITITVVVLLVAGIITWQMILPRMKGWQWSRR